MAVATRFWTLAELVTKIEKDLDLEGEVFIQPEELVGYINEAIDEAEKEVTTLHKDYFLCRTPLTLVSGTSKYPLPSTIYAHKIRRIVYLNGTRTYTIKRLKDWYKFEEYALDIVGGAQIEAEYAYILINETPGVPELLFTPGVLENGQRVTVWSIRQANRLVLDTDVMDIPEAANFVMRHTKVSCYEKEGHPNLAKALADLEKERQLLKDDLIEIVPDADNEIEMDLSIYEEMN